MKILLIMPDAHMHKLRLWGHVRSLREAPLTLTTLAGLAPAGPDLEIELADESVQPVPRGRAPDLVGISAITGCAPRAYELADQFRRRGAKVVLGGVHVSILPGEAAPHADALVVGRGEHAWPRLLQDFRRGRLGRLYVEEPIEDGWLTGVPPARRDLQKRSGYVLPDTVQATRGCKRTCDFCTVPGVWPRYLRRPVADVIDDLRRCRGRNVAFNDVSLADDPEYARELFTAMIPLRKRWGGLVTVDAASDAALVDLMRRSGCVYLLLGFESEDPRTLLAIRKGFNRRDPYDSVMRLLHGHGITVQGCFVFGFDGDDTSVFARTVERVIELKVDIPRYSIYTPYPGTALFARLLGENRILSFNWNDYDTMHAVIRPARMTTEELFDGFKWAYRETFRFGRIARRLRDPGFRSVLNGVGNLAYRIFVKRLYHEPRFAQPYSRGAPGRPPDPAHYREAWVAAHAGEIQEG